MLLGKNLCMWIWGISGEMGIEDDITTVMMIPRIIGKEGSKI